MKSPVPKSPPPQPRPICMLAILFGLATLTAAARADAPDVSLASLLQEMIDRDGAARFPDPAYTCRQASSYDRASVSADQPATWWANDDRSFFLRSEDHDGREEWVMMDADGPGCLVRVWVTGNRPRGTLRVYLDHASTPVIAAPVEDLVGGDALVGAPLSAERARGRNLYLPIPYARHCKVTYDRPNFRRTNDSADLLYYQINHRTYPPGTGVESFTPAGLEAARARIAEVQDLLLNPARGVPAALTPHRVEGKALAPGDTLAIPLSGPGAVRRLMVRVQADDLALATRQTVLTATFDGEDAVWCPIGDFFGSGVGMNPYQGWWREVTPDGQLICYWPMPFQRDGKLQLVNHGEQTVTVTIQVETGKWQWDERSMHFRANWRQEGPLATQPRSDWNYIRASGTGVYRGDTLCVVNPVEDWWGEGDEKIFVDGETFPSHLGTGTEDYYGYAWCTPEFFQSPFHAQPRVQGPRNFGHATNTRVRLLDGIPFQHSFRFDMEVWHWKDCQIPYAVATYWYALPGATADPQPDNTSLRVFDFPTPVPPEVRMVPGALEGETLQIASVTGGRTEGQALADVGWSNGKQLWWIDGQPGDLLTVVFPVEKAGRYALSAECTKAVDYGIAQLAVDDAPLLAPIDFYNDGVIRQVYELGTHTLAAGDHRLTITLTGANPLAIARHMVGLDYLLLVPDEPEATSGAKE